MSEIIVAPSLLASDWGAFREEIENVTKAEADWLHLDVMDGHFVPPITFGPDVVAVAKDCTDIPLDVHLMIEKPERQLKNFADAGADSITVHAETCPHLHRTLHEIRSLGCLAGVALNPATPVDVVEHVIDLCDIILIMTVNPGWGGQQFIDTTLDKVSLCSDIIEEADSAARIQVDGGINQETARACVDAGARILVAGTYIFGSRDYAKSISSLRD